MAVVILHVHKYGKKKKVTRKFKSGGLHERHVRSSSNLETWEPSQHSLVDTGKPKNTCVAVAGRWNLAGRRTLCYVMLCYVMLCYVMLCYVMLNLIINTSFEWSGHNSDSP